MTMQKIKVVPADGQLIRDPDNLSRIIPKTGGEVPNNTFWRRRIRDGSVTKVSRFKKDEPVAAAPLSSKGGK